jgi:hypothetical protein
MAYNRTKTGGSRCLELLEFRPVTITYYDKFDKKNKFHCLFTKEHFEQIITMLKQIQDNNSNLIYVLYITMTEINSSEIKSCLKIGKSKSMRNFLDKGGRLDDHTKNYICNDIILLNVFEIKDNLDEIEYKLHEGISKDLLKLGIQDPYAGLVKRTPSGNISQCKESYLFYKELYDDIGPRIKQMESEINGRMMIDS